MFLRANQLIVNKVNHSKFYKLSMLPHFYIICVSSSECTLIVIPIFHFLDITCNNKCLHWTIAQRLWSSFDVRYQIPAVDSFDVDVSLFSSLFLHV